MKKKLKLKNWVKVVITLILIAVGIAIYVGLGNIGSVGTKLANFLCITGWVYLVFGQILILASLWEN